jgi:hypothetical protein
MKSLRKGAWQSKRGSSPAIPAYRPPRQTRTSKKAESVLAPEIVACESEASLEIVESKSDSEEDTCFGVVWEKMPEPVQTITETVVRKGCKIMSYREALETSRYGEVLRWSSDSEGETEKSDGVGKPKVSCPFDGLIVPETELQNSPVKARVEGTETEMTVTEATATETTVTETTVTEATMTETVIQPVKVAKNFEAGLFIGEITAVSIKRGRNLYTVLYEDGDGEDMNDREYKEARALYEQTKGCSGKLVVNQTEIEEIDDEPLHSGGETEGSEFASSDDEHEKNRKKKNATKCALRKKRRKNENGGTM